VGAPVIRSPCPGAFDAAPPHGWPVCCCLVRLGPSGLHPLPPVFSEEIYRNLVVGAGVVGEPPSVQLQGRITLRLQVRESTATLGLGRSA